MPKLQHFMLAGEDDSVVKRRPLWVVFCGVQLLGCSLVGFASLMGQGTSQSPLVMFPWLAGFLLLLPGDLLAIALDDRLNRVPTFTVRFLVTLACNAIFWVACSLVWRIWRKLRHKHQVQRL
jgi:hypothetical protein